MSSNFTYPPITEAQMLLGTSDKMILAVEGHTDKRYFNGIIDTSKISIIHSNGRSIVCQLVNQLEPQYSGRVFGVCDNDFLNIGVGTHTGNEVFHTDYHDLEMDALFVGNFSAQLNMMLSPEKLQGKGWNSDTVIEKIFDMVLPIAYFRLINEKEGLNLDFKDYKLKKNKHFNSNFKLNIIEYIKTIVEKNGGGELLQEAENIKSKIEHEMKTNHDKFIICNGHDFVYVLREILKEIGVRSSSKIHSEEGLTDIILGTYTKQDFLNSNLGGVFSSKLVI